jgi:hypothetical protein
MRNEIESTMPDWVESRFCLDVFVSDRASQRGIFEADG